MFLWNSRNLPTCALSSIRFGKVSILGGLQDSVCETPESVKVVRFVMLALPERNINKYSRNRCRRESRERRFQSAVLPRQ